MYTISHVWNTSLHCGSASMMIYMMPMGIIGVSRLTTDWQGIISCPGGTILHPTGVRMMMMAQMSHHVRKKKWALSGAINSSDGNDLGCGGLRDEMQCVWAHCEDGSDRYMA